jgi:glycerophosphoryl diester phosphodiesterase
MTFAKSTRILNVAHRGARAFAPENTLVAFAKAKKMGCEMFEMDIRVTKDGEIVVFHDEDLIRCTDAKKVFPDRESYYLADFTFEELRQLDVGSWYVEQLALSPDERQSFLRSLDESEMAKFVTQTEQQHYASGAIKIPSLEETLALAKDSGLMVNIEIKGQAEEGSELVSKLLQAINSITYEEMILISSFEHDWLRQIRQRTKTIKTAILTGNPLHAPVGYLRKIRANAYNLCRFEKFKDQTQHGLAFKQYLSHIKKIRKAGFDVYVWTCNDREEMQYLFELEITGIISDYPNRVREQSDNFVKQS